MWDSLSVYYNLQIHINDCSSLSNRCITTPEIFLQKIGPCFIILYGLYRVDPVYLCMLGIGVCIDMNGGRVDERMVKLFITF